MYDGNGNLFLKYNINFMGSLFVLYSTRYQPKITLTDLISKETIRINQWASTKL